MAINKQVILDALRDLPDDAQVEEAMERLYFLQKVQLGLDQVEKGETQTHEEVKERLKPWLE